MMPLNFWQTCANNNVIIVIDIFMLRYFVQISYTANEQNWKSINISLIAREEKTASWITLIWDNSYNVSSCYDKNMILWH